MSDNNTSTPSDTTDFTTSAGIRALECTLRELQTSLTAARRKIEDVEFFSHYGLQHHADDVKYSYQYTQCLADQLKKIYNYLRHTPPTR